MDIPICLKGSNIMNVSQNGMALIERFEGLRLTAYRDIVGVLTIGYGHTGPDVTPGMTISQGQANILLQKDLVKFATGVNNLVKVPLNQNQFDALVSFAYNLGLGNLGSSTLLKLLNAGDYAGAQGQFIRWNKAGGQVVAGLTTRRQAEANLFASAQ